MNIKDEDKVLKDLKNERKNANNEYKDENNNRGKKIKDIINDERDELRFGSKRGE